MLDTAIKFSLLLASNSINNQNILAKFSLITIHCLEKIRNWISFN